MQKVYNEHDQIEGFAENMNTSLRADVPCINPLLNSEKENKENRPGKGQIFSCISLNPLIPRSLASH